MSLDGMLPLVTALPDHLAGSERLLDGLSPRPAPAAPRRVLLCGMGGSAIAGDVARPFLARQGVDLTVWREYDLPSWADASALVVLCSYSGDTEETLTGARLAVAAGCPVLGIASGGELLARGRDGGWGRPFPVIALPAGLPPRAALGHGLGALLGGLHACGAIGSPAAASAAAVAVLREGVARLGPDVPENPAVRIARSLLGRFTVVYTTSPEAHGAGARLKAQINENAKSPAYAVALPELDHNDIVGWEVLRPRRDAFALVILRGGDEHPRTALRVAATLDLVGGEFHAVHEIGARGDGPLARSLSLVQFGDYLSCYMARAAGVDPVPVARIDALKARLRGGTAP